MQGLAQSMGQVAGVRHGRQTHHIRAENGYRFPRTSPRKMRNRLGQRRREILGDRLIRRKCNHRLVEGKWRGRRPPELCCGVSLTDDHYLRMRL